MMLDSGSSESRSESTFILRMARIYSFKHPPLANPRLSTPSRLIDWPKSLSNVAQTATRAQLEAPYELPPRATLFRCCASGSADSDRDSSVGDRSNRVGFSGKNRKRAR